MEDYYYFPASLETVQGLDAGFPGVHFASHHQSSSSQRPRRGASRAGAGELGLLHHYLDACFRCERALAGNKDIFMYRGDTPFCSEECRRQQIEADEAREKTGSNSKQQPGVAARSRELRRQSPRGTPLWAR